MRHPLVTRSPRILAAPLVALGVLAAVPAGAAAATTWSFDATAAKLTVEAPDTGGIARISRTAAGALQVNGTTAGAATVRNTDTIAVTGGLGLQQVVVDLSGGPLAPGKTAETGTGAISEIELIVDAGTGNEFPLGDELRILGGAAADTLRFAAKDALLTGDDDADVITANVEALAAEGRGGEDRILGAGATLPLRLSGGDAADELTGGGGADLLEGGPGDDIENGGDGADTFRQGAAADGADTLDGGGSPFDRIDYSQRTAAVRIDLDGVADDGAAGERDDVLDSFEYLAGGSGGDTIVASTARFNSFDIAGNGGDDTISGGDNFDELNGGEGNDTISGGKGSDTFRAGPGNDTQRGDDGSDTFNETEATANGQDSFFGGSGTDHYYAPDRTAAMKVTLADNAANDGETGELDNVRSDVENVTTGKGADTITGASAPNTVSGGAGDDVIDAGAGDDVVSGRAGKDRIAGGAGKDDLSGYEDDDRVDGGTEDDIVRGGDGKDALAGGAGADRLFGERDDDVLTEPTLKDGGDALTGGDGTDTVTYNLRSTAVAVTLDGAANDGDQAAPAENDNVSAERVVGSRVADRLSGSGERDTLDGAGGADAIDGLGGDDTLIGGPAGDTLTGGDGVDVTSYAGRTQALKVTVGGGADDGATGEGDDVRTEKVLGGSGGDALTGDRESNGLDGGAGDDTLDGAGGADVLTGGDGTDTVTYAGRSLNVTASIDGVANDGTENEQDDITATVENLVGGSGDDTLTGGEGANTLSGGPNADVLDGGAGADVLDGQGGRDTADYRTRNQPLVLAIDEHATDGTDTDGDGDGDEGDKISETVEILQGGSAGDRLIGSDAANDLYGNGGRDRLSGGDESADGNDRLSGGNDIDTASYEGRADTDPVVLTLDDVANDGAREAGEKDNVLFDVENLTGGRGDDDLTGSSKANVLNGGSSGKDVMHGENGDDRLEGGPDPETPSADADELWGGEGSDFADYSQRTRGVGIALDDLPNDGALATDTEPTEGDNVHGDIEAAAGGAGGDVLWGTIRSDRLDGRAGGDRILGRGGDDTLIGGSEVDRINGDSGNDRVFGGPGNNVLSGGPGDDIFVEEARWVGNDGYNGGTGRDTVNYAPRGIGVLLDNDNETGDDGQDANLDGDAEERDRINTDVEELIGGDGRDRITNTREADDRCSAIHGRGGDDILTGSDSRDNLLGGDGSDTLNGGEGDDTLAGEKGADLENGGDGDDDFVQGEFDPSCAGRNLFEITGGDGADRLIGGDDTDEVIYRRTANTGVNVSLDGNANDGVPGEGDNVSVEDILGGSGNDQLAGDGNDNRIVGFLGDDVVRGGAGDDTMLDRSGIDTIFGDAGGDEILVDDNQGGDTIDGGADDDDGEWDAEDIVSNMD